MVSHEKSAAETPVDAELVSEIQADIESSELYLSLSDALRIRVDRELRRAIEQKIRQFSNLEDIRTVVATELKSFIEQEFLQEQVLNRRLAEIKESILTSSVYIELGEYDSKLQQKVLVNINKFIRQAVHATIRENFSTGAGLDIDTIVFETTLSLMRRLEKDVRREKILRSLSGPIRSRVEQSDVYVNLSPELKEVVTSQLDYIVSEELTRSIDVVPEDQLLDTVVKGVLSDIGSLKGTATDRIVGKMTDKERQERLLKKINLFSKQERHALPDVEREKTKKEIELLNRANDLTNELLQEMGLEAFDVPLENIHIIKASKWDEKLNHLSGRYHHYYENISMRESPKLSVFFAVAVHELLHMKSYQASQLTTGNKPRMKTYRMGMTTISRDGKKEYFTRLNEGVTEELTKKICEVELKTNPLLQEEHQRTEALRKQLAWSARNILSGRQFNKDTYNAYRVSKNRIIVNDYAYVDERKSLGILVEKISKKSGESEESVLKAFAKSMMKGQFIDLARMIEDAFGGGTFRKIGSIMDAKELLSYVKGL